MVPDDDKAAVNSGMEGRLDDVFKISCYGNRAVIAFRSSWRRPSSVAKRLKYSRMQLVSQYFICIHIDVY